MGFGSLYLSSPGWCFSIEDYNKYINENYHNIDNDDEKYFLIGFNYLIVMNAKKTKCFQLLSHRILVTCTYCQNDFRTFTVRYSACCWLIERKVKTKILEELKKLATANVYKTKRRKKEYIKDELVR